MSRSRATTYRCCQSEIPVISIIVVVLLVIFNPVVDDDRLRGHRRFPLPWSLPLWLPVIATRSGAFVSASSDLKPSLPLCIVLRCMAKGTGIVSGGGTAPSHVDIDIFFVGITHLD
jgi:hypothetical protein